jgi:predicted neuraminidase
MTPTLALLGAAILSAATPTAIAQEVVQPANPELLREFIYTQAPYPQAHASTIVELKSGTLAAAWFGGTGERNPDVEIWFARRGPKGWERPVSIANGIQAGGPRLPTWNPVLFRTLPARFISSTRSARAPRPGGA